MKVVLLAAFTIIHMIYITLYIYIPYICTLHICALYTHLIYIYIYIYIYLYIYAARGGGEEKENRRKDEMVDGWKEGR